MEKKTTAKKVQHAKEQVVNVDATRKPIGRLATEVATIIHGKTSPSFTPDRIPAISVVIENIDKINVSEKKLDENAFYRSSGYPGGLKRITWKKLYSKSPQTLFLKVIQNMLPRNTLRKTLLKKISFK